MLSLRIFSAAIALLPQVLARHTSGAQYATILNFQNPSLLNGDDGMAPSPAAPLRYGAPVLGLDTDGNGIDNHESHIFFYEGKYYLYSHAWACGQLTTLTGVTVGGAPEDSGGECGILTYSSPDLMHWTKENLYQPATDGYQKPQALYSESLSKYVLWWKGGGNLNATGCLNYALGDSPAGPWDEAQIATGDHLCHDFDIAADTSGKYYVLTDVFSKYDPDVQGKPLWDVWIQQLNDDLTGTVGTDKTMAQLMASAVDYQAVGLVEHNGWWYITGGPTAGNAPTQITYMRSPHPLGPWTNEAGDTGDNLTAGTVIAQAGCTGQNKAISKFASSSGKVILNQVLGYRTSPSNTVANGVVVHGDNSQAIATTYYFPLEFDDNNHRILPLKCQTQISVLLMKTKAPQESPPTPYQPDCRIRLGSTISQTFNPPAHFLDDKISIPVWQMTDDLGLSGNNGTHLLGPLDITVKFTNGKSVTQSFDADEVSWVPQIVEIDIPRQSSKSAVKEVIFKSTGANGCYGTLVEPKIGEDRYGVSYSNGTSVAARKAQLVVF